MGRDAAGRARPTLPRPRRPRGTGRPRVTAPDAGNDAGADAATDAGNDGGADRAAGGERRSPSRTTPLGRRARARLARSRPTGELAVATLARNEGAFLPEWLAFQRLMGVQRVYLYDDGSDDGTRDLVAEAVREGYVEFVDWPAVAPDGGAARGTPQWQKLAFVHALERAGHLWRWMAFIDVDEFLFPAEQPDLVTFLRDYEDLPALVAFWRMFGTSGFATTPEPPIIEHLTMMAPFPTYANTKTIVQPRHVRSISNVHVFDTTAGDQTAHDEHRRPFTAIAEPKLARASTSPMGATADLLLLNHYFARSVEAHAAKDGRLHAMGRDRRVERRRLIQDLIEREVREDLAIQRFVPALRTELGVGRPDRPAPVPPDGTASGAGRSSAASRR